MIITSTNPPPDMSEVTSTAWIPTNEEKLILYALDALDTDASPEDIAPDILGCAESVSNIIKKVLPDFPILTSTKDLDMKMFTDKRFKRCEIPNRGRIIVSPRTRAKNGHVSIQVDYENLASSDSRTGLFQKNYTWQKWIEEFKYKRGLNIYIYELLG